MGAWGAIIGAVVGGVAGSVSSYLTSVKQADAYKDAAKQIRQAMDKYSGDAASNRIKAAGYNEARLRNSAALQQLGRVNQDNPLSVQNFQNAESNIDNYDMMQANQTGREREAGKLNAQYDYATTQAQNALKQAGIEANAQRQAYQTAMNTAGNLAGLYGQFARSSSGGSSSGSSGSNPSSDERVKEAPKETGSKLPESDIEDSLRQIDTIQYQYKNPELPGEDNEIHESGITAQSLEKTPLFKDAVDNSGEIKRIDQWKLQEALTAGIAQLQKEIDELENK